MMKTPFFDKIKAYADAYPARFHMPGHKGRMGGFLSEVSRYDVTELNQTENLFFPGEALLEAERLTAKLFGVKTTLFCAGGATLGNQTALSFFAGKKVVFERNIHVSVFNAAMLSDIEQVFVYNSFDRISGEAIPITAEQIDAALAKNTDAQAVFITSPSYTGMCADCREIKKICEKHGVVLIIDNAHGSHMRFTGDSSAYLADIIVNSAHKTLPALTGGAFIHFNTDVSREEAAGRMLSFGSSSPSFLILASLDCARAWCEENKNEFTRTSERVKKLKETLVLHGADVLSSDIYDPMRLLITAKNADDINEKLINSGIFAEYCDGRNIVFMFSPFNMEDEFSKLESVLLSCSFVKAEEVFNDIPKAVQAITAKRAFYGENREEGIKNAVGEIAAKPVIPYPPGVPVLLPGELITEETACYLAARGIEKVRVI